MVNKGKRRRREPGEINLSPLIDMTFILLIFFMVSTTFVRDLQIDLERPGARTAQQADNRTLRVHVDRRGDIYVDGRQIQPWMLQSRVRENLSRSRVKTVLVVADRRVETGKLVEVVDQCRLAGAQEVGVAVEGEM